MPRFQLLRYRLHADRPLIPRPYWNKGQWRCKPYREFGVRWLFWGFILQVIYAV